jgi:hypothetical protein
MRARATFATATWVALGALTACGAVLAQPARSSNSLPPACAARPRAVCITRSDGDRTVSLGLGRTIVLVLATPGGNWSAPSEIGTHVLSPLGAPSRSGGGVTVIYRAAQPGTTTLRALERPVCAPGRMCPQFVLLWQVRIRVLPRG